MMRTIRQLSFLTLLTATAAQAQIPNGGFENWVDLGGFQDPTGWTSLNSLTIAVGGGLSCERAIPAATGNFGVKITTLNLPGLSVLPGLLLYGEADASVEGFPYNSRPQALNGKWKAAIAAADEGAVVVTLTRWNASLGEREDIGGGIASVTGTVNAWTSFSAAIQYSSAQNPDTASIFILSSASSSGVPVAGSTLSVDDLSFGSATSVPELTAGSLTIFPVPAVDDLTVTAPATMQELSLWSIDGRLMLTTRPGDLRAIINVSDLPAGTYAVQVRLNDGRTLRQVITRQ